VKEKEGRTLQNVEDLSRALNRFRNEQIRILKEEDGDRDRVEMTLAGVETYRRGGESFDDYIGDRAVFLRGEGTVAGGSGSGPLPQNQYEIPLDGAWSFCADGRTCRVTTDRAVYTIAAREE
jgi:hypothetical protein